MPDLRLKEFFYVDVDRTRSLLAQLQGSVVETMTSESANTFEAGASASLFGIGGSGGYGREARSQESRSFQEMVFVAFEALADEQEMITDLGDEVRDAAQWRTGQVHQSLSEGQLIRLQCDVQTLDGSLFGERIARFEKMAGGIFTLNPEPTPKHSTPQQRARMSQAAVTALLGGVTPDRLAALTDFVNAFVGEGISFRALPCGREHLDLGFGGSLLGVASTSRRNARHCSVATE